MHPGATGCCLVGSAYGAYAPRPVSDDDWISAFGMVATACLILPTLWYALFYDRCDGPNREVIHMLCGGFVIVSAAVLALVNFSRVRRADAGLCTIAQAFLVAALLAVGSVPPLLWDLYLDARYWRWEPCPSRRL